MLQRSKCNEGELFLADFSYRNIIARESFSKNIRFNNDSERGRLHIIEYKKRKIKITLLDLCFPSRN